MESNLPNATVIYLLLNYIDFSIYSLQHAKDKIIEGASFARVSDIIKMKDNLVANTRAESAACFNYFMTNMLVIIQQIGLSKHNCNK